MIKNKWRLKVEFMSELNWNGYVMLLGVINPSHSLDNILEYLLNLLVIKGTLSRLNPEKMKFNICLTNPLC